MPNKYLILATVSGSTSQVDHACNKADADLLAELYREELGIKVIIKVKLNPNYGKGSK